MEPVEDGQRTPQVRDHGPRPQAVELQRNWVRARPRLLEHTHDPQRQIGDQQEDNKLTTRSFSRLINRTGRSSTAVQDEHRLADSLQDGKDRSDPREDGLGFQVELGAQDRQGAVQEQPNLRSNQQILVQVESAHSIVRQSSHANRSDEDGQHCDSVECQLAEGQLREGQFLERVLVQEHEESSNGCDRGGQNENAEEQTLVTLTTVDNPETARDRRVVLQDTNGSGGITTHITPHEVENDGADECVLDAAGEQVR